MGDEVTRARLEPVVQATIHNIADVYVSSTLARAPLQRK